MEQSIDPSIQPVPAAGTDPAFIPGLTPPRPAPTQEEVSSAPAGAADDAATEGETPHEDPASETDEDAEAPAAEADAAERDAEAPAENAEAAEENDETRRGDGPSFEAVDRRGSITADRTGVLFRLDDQEADFTWDEIGAVEVETPRFAKRFTVTVHVEGARRRSYSAEVDAPSRSRLKEWEAQLDAVLDAYFDDEDADADEADATEATEATEATDETDETGTAPAGERNASEGEKTGAARRSAGADAPAEDAEI